MRGYCKSIGTSGGVVSIQPHGTWGEQKLKLITRRTYQTGCPDVTSHTLYETLNFGLFRGLGIMSLGLCISCCAKTCRVG